MNFSIVFENSGDSIPFATISNTSADVLVYYVENLNNQKLNNFTTLGNYGNNLGQLIDTLQSTIEQCNNWSEHVIEQLLPVYSQEDCLVQQNLNSLHVLWVKSQNQPYHIHDMNKKYNLDNLIVDMFPDSIPVTTVATVLHKLGLDKIYNKINENVHTLEAAFQNIKFSTPDTSWFTIPNPFSKDMVSNSICNFVLPFNHLGRTLYGKFQNYDVDLSHDDENSFNELLGFVTLRLSRPESISFSQQYVDWCSAHNRSPTGHDLNIGNIPNLTDNLTSYRQIIFRNTLQSNSFSIQLTKG